MGYHLAGAEWGKVVVFCSVAEISRKRHEMELTDGALAVYNIDCHFFAPHDTRGLASLSDGWLTAISSNARLIWCISSPHRRAYSGIVHLAAADDYPVFADGMGICLVAAPRIHQPLNLRGHSLSGLGGNIT